MAGKVSGSRPQDYMRRRERAEGWDIDIVSYKLGERYLCEIDNVDPGARIARGEGTTREEAERSALEAARKRLAMTRRHSLH